MRYSGAMPMDNVERLYGPLVVPVEQPDLRPAEGIFKGLAGWWSLDEPGIRKRGKWGGVDFVTSGEALRNQIGNGFLRQEQPQYWGSSYSINIWLRHRDGNTGMNRFMENGAFLFFLTDTEHGMARIQAGSTIGDAAWPNTPLFPRNVWVMLTMHFTPKFWTIVIDDDREFVLERKGRANKPGKLTLGWSWQGDVRDLAIWTGRTLKPRYQTRLFNEGLGVSYDELP